MGRGGGGGRKGGGAARSESSAGVVGAAAGASVGAIGMDAMHSAFIASKGVESNFVSLDEFRRQLGGTRQQQDAAIREGRLAGIYSLDSHEGLHSPTTESQRQAAIDEWGERLVYISKRNGG